MANSISMKSKKNKSRLFNLFLRNKKPILENKPKISLSSLKNMVKTKEQEDVLKIIEFETIPSVRDAWIDYFLEISKRKNIKVKRTD